MPVPNYLTTRRDFIRIASQGMGLAALGSIVPSVLAKPTFTSLEAAGAPNSILVLIHLSGGNDGLNTVIPYTNDDYYRARPTIGISSREVIKLNSSRGLHPACLALYEIYSRGELAIVNSVGYPNPNRSHFGANRVWDTATPEEPMTQTGWVGRFLDHTYTNVHAETDPIALCFSSGALPLLTGEKQHTICALDTSTDTFTTRHSESWIPSFSTRQRLQRAQRMKSSGRSIYPTGLFAQNLQTVANLIASNFSTRVYSLTLSGFDTHSHQSHQHHTMLQILSDGLSAFQKDLQSKHVDDQVITMAYSEFGRRPHENAARGTDHGTATPVFLMGSKIKGGFHGEHAELPLSAYADLEPTTDFRQIYATLLDDWLQCPSIPVLGGKADRLPLI